MDIKTVQESALEDHSQLVFPMHLNARGRMFGGELIKMMDIAATIIARRHSGKMCATVSILAHQFRAPIYIEDMLVFKGSVNRVWRTSMEIGIKAFISRFGKSDLIPALSAYFMVVAVDENDEPVPIGIDIIPIGKTQKKRWNAAEKRKKQLLKIRKNE